VADILSRYPAYEATIGIEVHVQLNTKTKIFCSCSTSFAQTPNSTICQICTGQPGVLPVLNKEVVTNAIKLGLSTNCTIEPFSEFARKHYFYPDLPKNYQITQAEHPICLEGHVSIRCEDGSFKNIRLIRIHMEEDAGKNLHDTASNESFVDLNRTGTPLLEIVSYPDISNSYEAREYLKMLRLIVLYLDICSGNMEEGAFRADTNISVRKKGQKELGTKCELKNINSFKFIADATDYEIERQITVLEAGGRIRQETRLWDTKEQKTIIMRSKEEAADYRYFADPDLAKVVITPEHIKDIEAQLPELPTKKFERLCAQYGLTPYEADILVQDLSLARFYETAAQHTTSKQLINWILRDLMGYLKQTKYALTECPIKPEHIAQLVDLLEQGVINNRGAQELFGLLPHTEKSPRELVKERGLEQMDNSQEMEQLIIEIIKANPHQASAYKAGQEKLFGFFVGQAMQKTKGKGNPQTINELLKKHLLN